MGNSRFKCCVTLVHVNLEPPILRSRDVALAHGGIQVLRNGFFLEI